MLSNLISTTGTLVTAKEEQNDSTTDNATESNYFADRETSSSLSGDETSVPDEKDKPTNYAKQGNQYENGLSVMQQCRRQHNKHIAENKPINQPLLIKCRLHIYHEA